MNSAVSISLNMPKADLGFARQMAKRMGWTINKQGSDRLFDPETNMFLNEETMQAIHDVEAGKVKRCRNLDELIAAL